MLFCSLASLMLPGATLLPSDLTLCHRGLLVVVTATELALVFKLILLLVVTRSLDTDLLVTNREVTSFRSLRVVGGRIALIWIELFKGTALFVAETGAALVLFGTAAGCAATRRLDIVQARLVVNLIIRYSAEQKNSLRSNAEHTRPTYFLFVFTSALTDTTHDQLIFVMATQLSLISIDNPRMLHHPVFSVIKIKLMKTIFAILFAPCFVVLIKTLFSEF